jgi:hypothetical protein
MLYLFVATVSALHTFNLIHPKILKTKYKEAMLPLIPLQTSKLCLQGEWYISFWVETSLCPLTVMDETLNLNSSAYAVLVCESLLIADTGL